MELVLWRHAEAEESADDAARRLTAKGVRQAHRMAAWLNTRLSKDATMIVSPAQRARETAQALSRKSVIQQLVNTGARPADVLHAAGWPDGEGTVVVVGHQPTLGAAAALAVTGTASAWRIGKGCVWWISSSRGSPKVIAVMTPELV